MTELKVGTNGQLLTVSGSLPSWQDAPASGVTSITTSSQSQIGVAGTGSGVGPYTGAITLSIPNPFIIPGDATVSGALTLTTKLAVAQGGTGLASGTSGGVPYFNASSTMLSSGALSVSQVVLGGGAGGAPTSLAAGSANQLLHAGTPPTWSAVALGSAEVSGTLAVTNGGTGLSSCTTGDLLVGSGSNTLTKLAISASNGDVLISNGTTTAWSSNSWANAGTQALVFTTGTAVSQTIPAGVTKIKVTVVGGGGGGGGGGTLGGGSGGGGGGSVIQWFSGLTGGSTTVTYTVGAGGAGGTAGNNAGSTGGNTTALISTGSITMTASGGGGGSGSGGNVAIAAGGSASTSGGSNSIAMPGGYASVVISSAASGGTVFGGRGGSSMFGDGGVVRLTQTLNTSVAGVDGIGYGGGGSSAAAYGGTAPNVAGGNGTGGIIVIEY